MKKSHRCSKTESTRSEIVMGNLSLCERLKLKILQVILVSPKNPLCALYFRSETAMREERMKQMRSRYPYIVHPLSMFRLIYDFLITILHVGLVVTKPFDAALSRSESLPLTGYVFLSLTFDCLSWIDIAMTFRTGYLLEGKKKIIMHPRKIAMHYISSTLFFADILSSIPRYTFWLFVEDVNKYKILNRLSGVIIILCQLKVIRLVTIISNIYKLSRCFNIRSKGAVFWLSGFLITTVIIHWTACLQLTLPRLRRDYFAEDKKEYTAWLKKYKLLNKSFISKYINAFFKSSACFLGIRVNLRQMLSSEDYVLIIITYIIGKIVVCCLWIVITVSILSNRSMEIKFYSVKNELDEYMRQKQLPMNLREKITQIYLFKYPRKYFRDSLVDSLLSGRLKKDINLHVCRNLIKNVSVFSKLDPDQISDVVDLLVPEIFLPNETIIQAGTPGNDIYFIFTGTVAVYTHSGKEICHLQDGAYFGEISLLFRDHLRTATIVAIEITHVFRLKRKDFEKSLLNNATVFRKIQSQALIRMDEIRRAEERYKKIMFEKTYRYFK